MDTKMQRRFHTTEAHILHALGLLDTHDRGDFTHLLKSLSIIGQFILVKEVWINKSQTCFISKKTHKNKIRKTSPTLVVASRNFRHYFLSLSIVVRNDQPLEHVHFKTNLTGRMTKCSIEISEFDIFFELIKTLKAYAFIDFIA